MKNGGRASCQVINPSMRFVGGRLTCCSRAHILRGWSTWRLQVDVDKELKLPCVSRLNLMLLLCLLFSVLYNFFLPFTLTIFSSSSSFT